VKVSEWLRQYQITGEVPDSESADFAFWCGWLLGGKTKTATNMGERREMAIKAAEFIEACAK
jgi:hypothetical protein